MRTIIPTLIAALLLGGCIVHTRGAPPPRRAERTRACPPAHHWEGGVCVHNGKAKGHYK